MARNTKKHQRHNHRTLAIAALNRCTYVLRRQRVVRSRLVAVALEPAPVLSVSRSDASTRLRCGSCSRCRRSRHGRTDGIAPPWCRSSGSRPFRPPCSKCPWLHATEMDWMVANGLVGIRRKSAQCVRPCHQIYALKSRYCKKWPHRNGH